jgi:hypothetical protein
MKMKKSKIIYPAVALLLLSTAASVTGTVAWFTANKTFNMSATTFKVVKTESGLSTTLAELYGVTKAADSDTLTVNGLLTDASYSIAGNVLYTDVAKDDGTQPEAYTSLEAPSASNTKWLAVAAANTDSSINKDIYYGVAWTIDFEYSFGSTKKDAALFLNAADSKITRKNSATGDLNTYKGFRIGFYTTSTGGVSKVWAPANQVVGSGATDTKYVNSTSATAEYTAANAIDNATKTKITSWNGTKTDDAQYLGKFTYNATTAQHLVFTCVAWFEGEDHNVVNEATLDELDVALAFNVVDAA